MANIASSPNRDTLIEVATLISSLLDEVVFVGGQVAELLVSAPEAVRIRATDDVDIVVRATTKLEYHEVEVRLTALGLQPDASDGAPICRWRTTAGHKLDVMPIDGGVLGFSSRWYPLAVKSAKTYALTADLSILIPGAPVFLATKWEAFMSRGEEDYLGSHDLEDIIAVVAGRPELEEEFKACEDDVRDWLAKRAEAFLAHELADYAIQGAVPDASAIPELLDAVRKRFRALT